MGDFMFTRKHFLTAIVFVLATVSFGCFASTGSYKVSTALSHNGKVFSSPTVIVKSGVPASIKVSGKNGYKLSVTVTELGGDEVKVSSKFTSEQYGHSSP